MTDRYNATAELAARAVIRFGDAAHQDIGCVRYREIDGSAGSGNVPRGERVAVKRRK